MDIYYIHTPIFSLLQLNTYFANNEPDSKIIPVHPKVYCQLNIVSSFCPSTKSIITKTKIPRLVYMLVTQLENICFCDYWFCACTKTPAIVVGILSFMSTQFQILDRILIFMPYLHWLLRVSPGNLVRLVHLGLILVLWHIPKNIY